MVDNQETWLTMTDLVFIDPVGTGYSRATKANMNRNFTIRMAMQRRLLSLSSFIWSGIPLPSGNRSSSLVLAMGRFGLRCSRISLRGAAFRWLG
jgi:hypothetical protein